VNVFAVLRMVRAVAPVLRRQGGGRIVTSQPPWARSGPARTLSPGWSNVPSKTVPPRLATWLESDCPARSCCTHVTTCGPRVEAAFHLRTTHTGRTARARADDTPACTGRRALMIEDRSGRRTTRTERATSKTRESLSS
jgi:hypothetical protein